MKRKIWLFSEEKKIHIPLKTVNSVKINELNLKTEIAKKRLIVDFLLYSVLLDCHGKFLRTIIKTIMDKQRETKK